MRTHRFKASAKRYVRQFLDDERGEDLVEWTVGLPVFLVLCAGIAFYAWLWWNQVSAAAAVHDGTYFAAIRGGSIAEGQTRTMRMLQASVGSFSHRYETRFGASAAERSVIGIVRSPNLFNVPFIGPLTMRIQASSFQRQEQFYGGPPSPWW
ncbi:MAG: pilus assembly protein [Chloroflexi bacterium]|nr:pilus assembly protein [Chloroflexota bacterium]